MRPPLAFAFSGLFVLATTAVADEAPPHGWNTQATLSGVFTGGNTRTATLGFRVKVGYDWPRSA